MYVYIRSEPGLWTVGHYDPAGKFHPESDHDSVAGATARVCELNGGPPAESVAPATTAIWAPELRDYFAGQALAGMFAGGSVKLPYAEGFEHGAVRAATLAYQFADAMLAAREVRS